MEVKKDIGGCDGADAPSSQLQICAIPQPSCAEYSRARGVPYAIGPDDALLSEVSEVRLALTLSSQYY